MFRQRLRRYQRYHTTTDGMPIARLVPPFARVEAPGAGISGDVPPGIHRRPILSRDLAERHARKVADMRVGVICRRVRRM